jgi:hypothetical protein
MVGRANRQALEGSRDVTGLLAHNPFPDKPPHYIRAMFYRYRFTNSEERRQTARGGNARNFGNICRRSPGISCVRSATSGRASPLGKRTIVHVV